MSCYNYSSFRVHTLNINALKTQHYSVTQKKTAHDDKF